MNSHSSEEQFVPTACGNCKHFVGFLFTDYCIAETKDAFDYRTGTMVKEFRTKFFVGMQDFVGLPPCATKNTGNCPDYSPK